MKCKLANKELEVTAENEIESRELEEWFELYVNDEVETQTKLHIKTFKISATHVN